MRNAGRKLAFLTHNQTFSKQIVSVATRVILFHKITSPPGDNPLFPCGKPRNCKAISGGRPMAAPTSPYGTARQTKICSPGSIRAVPYGVANSARQSVPRCQRALPADKLKFEPFSPVTIRAVPYGVTNSTRQPVPRWPRGLPRPLSSRPSRRRAEGSTQVSVLFLRKDSE